MFQSFWRRLRGRRNNIAAALLRHTQGATVTHAGPFARIEVPTLALEDVRPLYDDYVIPFYMKGLDQFESEEEAAFQRIRHSITDGIITTLLSDFNWRSRTTATYFALILDRHEHLDHIGKLLLRSDVCFAGAAYCRYLAHVRTPEAIDYLNQYLDYYLARTDLHFDQTDALAALQYIDATSGSNHAQVHASRLERMLRARPDFMKYVSLENLSSDLQAADRLRNLQQ